VAFLEKLLKDKRVCSNVRSQLAGGSYFSSGKDRKERLHSLIGLLRATDSFLMELGEPSQTLLKLGDSKGRWTVSSSRRR
jgi:hypothetical protein